MKLEQRYITINGKDHKFPQDFFDDSPNNPLKDEDSLKEKGWTIVFHPWDDDEGKPRVVGRFRTTKEKDEFLEKIYDPGSGWLNEELDTISCINDYNYTLPY